jgi:ketosteroid isomerase-like protein
MKKLLIVIHLLILLSFIFSCQQSKDAAKSEALRTLRDADKAWSQSAPDLEAFMSFIADDVIWFKPNGTQMFGKNEVRTYMERICALPSFSLTWTANGMDVSDAGDVGYVYGLYKWSYLNSKDSLVEHTNCSYATFWKKQTSGEWKVVLEADYYSSAYIESLQ